MSMLNVTCQDQACLCRTAPVLSEAATSLAAVVARLHAGEKVRVTFTDGVTAIGTLWGRSILHPEDDSLTLDAKTAYRQIRTTKGLPGPGVISVEPWDEGHQFDHLLEEAQDYLRLFVEARDCPKSEQEWRDRKVEEAKEAFIAEFIRGAA